MGLDQTRKGQSSYKRGNIRHKGSEISTEKMDTTVLNFGLLMLAFVFCILLGFIHKTTQGKLETIAERNYNQKWCFAQILLGVVFVFVVIILGIFAALKGSPTLKSMFEYVFVSSVDAILVLLFSFLCFLLLVKEDSPLRQNMPSEYFNLQEYGKEDCEDEIGLQEKIRLVWVPVWVWVPGWILENSKIFQKSAAAS